LLFLPDGNGVNMRKPVAAPVAARTATLPADNRNQAAIEMVCAALALAILVLACRIASFW
jgi:hypothetical protein